MMSTLSIHSRVLRTALKRMFASTLSGFLNIMVIGIALSLPAGMYVLLKNVQTLLEPMTGTSQISMYLEMRATPEEINNLVKSLAGNTEIKKVDFISRAEALAALSQNAGMNEVVNSLDTNPLPDTLIITPVTTNARSLELLRSKLAKMPHTDIVSLDSGWAYKLEAMLEFARIAILTLACLLSLGLIAITFNTIRLQIITQRDEILVSKLIGATDAFIRRPFLYFGAIQGLLGGITAWLIIAICLQLLHQPLAALSELYASHFSLQPLSAGDSLSLILFSVYLGWLGAWLSVSRHLSKIVPC